MINYWQMPIALPEPPAPEERRAEPGQAVQRSRVLRILARVRDAFKLPAY